MFSHLDYSSFEALNGGMEYEEKGQMFLLEHLLIICHPKANHSTIPLASHLFLNFSFGKTLTLQSKESILVLKQ